GRPVRIPAPAYADGPGTRDSGPNGLNSGPDGLTKRIFSVFGVIVTTERDETRSGDTGVMRVLLIGAPGAGEGTQATLIAERFGLTHISSGDLLRRHMREGTRLGRLVYDYVQRGDLVPDGIIMDMLYKPVIAASTSGGYVLDGFPRTVEQAEA